MTILYEPFKKDLEEVCRGLGIPTEGTKADLIQKIRDFSNEGNRDISEQSENVNKVSNENDDELTGEYLNEEKDILEYDLQTQTLRELAQKSKGKAKIPLPKPALPNIKEQDPKITGETKPAILGFDDRLNSVIAQIQDTRQRVEINDAWPNHKFEKYRDQHEYDTLRLVGRELDLAMESRNVQDAINCIESVREKIANRMFTLRVAEGYGWDIAAALPNTQDDWLKRKDSLIKKAKALADENATSVEDLATSQTPACLIQMKAPSIITKNIGDGSLAYGKPRNLLEGENSSLGPCYELAQKWNTPLLAKPSTTND
ncbi:26233_t:CDS:2, partial [Gigaspora rosea]